MGNTIKSFPLPAARAETEEIMIEPFVAENLFHYCIIMKCLF